MKKLDYLKLAIQEKKYHKKAWIISAFSITRRNSTTKVPDLLELEYTPTGYIFMNDKSERVVIEDASPQEPVFKFLDLITIDSSWCPNVTGTIETTIGNLLFNLIVMVEAFGTKIAFISGKINVKKIEKIVAPILVSDPKEDTEKEPTKIYVSEYVKFVDNLQFIGGLASLCVVSATPKNIQMAPGLSEFKKSLIKKYEGKFNDPTEFFKFEQELKAYDDEYLKDDPSMRGFMAGKIKNISRKKMYLTLGSGASFENDLAPAPVINSLHDGWPTDPKQFTALMNDSRSGSYSRGTWTVKGGVSAKILLRSTSNYRITIDDCGSKVGITRNYTKDDVSNLVGRYMLVNGIPKLIESNEEAVKFIGKDISVRSPMYCLVQGDKLCKTCAGKRLSENPDGLAIPITNISGTILLIFMKQFHGKVLSTSKLNINEVLT